MPGTDVGTGAVGLRELVRKDIPSRRDPSAQGSAPDESALYRRLFESLPEGVLVLDPEGRILLANQAAADLLGDSASDLLGCCLGIPIVGGEKCTVEIHLSNGSMRVTDLHATSATWKGNPAVIAMLRDVTEAQQTAFALARSENRFRELFDNIRSGIVIASADGNGGPLVVSETNRAVFQIEGVPTEAMIGLPLTDVLPEFSQDPHFGVLDRVVRSGSSDVIPARVVERARNGGWRQYAVCALSSSEVAIVYEDVSAAKETEFALQHAQKMEAVGELAGGVAHEFNNLLQTLIGAIQLMRLNRTPESTAHLLPMLETRIRHGASIVRQLLVFGRREVPRHDRLRLDELVDSCARLLRPILRANLAFHVDSGPVIWIEGDRGQLEQVIVNLVMNAADAMPDGGLIELVASPDGDSACIEVRDTGPGVPEAIRERIFEPFFTTKSDRGGAGLGLAVVHGIVAAHHGRIEVLEREVRGAAFSVRLPALESASPRVEVSSSTGAALPRGQREHILLVEDEVGTRETLAEMLTLLGYRPMIAGTAEEALALARVHEFDAVVTDYMLPGSNGRILAGRLQEGNPELAVIMLSGYAEQPGIRADVEAGRLRFLQKPCDMETLAAELAEVMTLSRRARRRQDETCASVS